MNVAELSCGEKSVIIALQFGGKQTYEELMASTELTRNPLMKAVRELRSKGYVQLSDTGNRRIIAVQLTMPKPMEYTTVYEMCINADESGDELPRLEAMEMTVHKFMPDFTGKAPTVENYRKWLRELGTTKAFYELIEKAGGNNVKAPINYIDKMIARRDKGQTWTTRQTVKPAEKTVEKPSEPEPEEEYVDMDLMRTMMRSYKSQKAV